MDKSVLLTNFFIDITPVKIFLLFIVTAVIGVLITFTVLLSIISDLKNKKAEILKNLEYFQNINLKERLNRINSITQNNPQYKNITNIWINRYQKILADNCTQIIKGLHKILENNQKDLIFRNRKLIRKTHLYTKKTKDIFQKLLNEVNYFTSTDQLLREYQLFFKQNFNYLQNEIIKVNLQNSINQAQLEGIIQILEIKFKELDDFVNDAKLDEVNEHLSEIAIGISALAEILVNLPSLNRQVYHLIPAKITQIKSQLKDQTLINQFQEIEFVISQKLLTIKELIHHLQYKKSKNLVLEILMMINKFNDDFQEQLKFQRMFTTNYQQYLKMNLNLYETFDKLNQNFTNLSKIQKLEKETEVINFKSELQKQIENLNTIETHLIVENEKSQKNLSYQQLLMLFCDVIEHSIIVFNNLIQYNQLLIAEIKPKIMIDVTINKVNSMMIQVENILTSMLYFFLSKEYTTEFNGLQKTLITVVYDIENHKLDLPTATDELNKIQNQVFQLYENIKIKITLYHLANSTLVYANRYRQDNTQLFPKFKMIEQQMKEYDFQNALVGLLKLME